MKLQARIGPSSSPAPSPETRMPSSPEMIAEREVRTFTGTGSKNCRPEVRLDDLADHPALEQREALVAAEVQIGQLLLVQADLVQDGRVDVAEVIGPFHRLQ